MKRPGSLTLIAVLLVLAAGITVVGGFVLTALSGCCGAPTEDSSYAVTGFLLAAPTAFAGFLVFIGGLTRWPTLAFAAVLPIGLAVASLSALDLADAAIAAVAGWVGLCVALASDEGRAWMAPRRVSR
jgi:hypothetical protein